MRLCARDARTAPSQVAPKIRNTQQQHTARTHQPWLLRGDNLGEDFGNGQRLQVHVGAQVRVHMDAAVGAHGERRADRLLARLGPDGDHHHLGRLSNNNTARARARKQQCPAKTGKKQLLVWWRCC